MKAFLTFVLLLALLAGAVFYLVAAPYGPSAETFVDIPMGTGTVGMAARLEQAGILRSRYAFEALRHIEGGTLHAGEYRFDRPASALEVYARIARGDVYTRTVVVPEGFNLYDVAHAVQAAGLGDAASFLTAARQNTSLIADLSPGAPSLEGYLFPDTYRFSRHAMPERMLATMVRRFRQQAGSLGILTMQGGTASNPDLPRLVTLASLIEKEVAVSVERPLVAGVFANRLALGMPLATDPSIAYTAMLNGRWTGVIHRSDLDFDSPYNTYRHAGLPPGPIANPGIAALRAAMHPTKTDYLYFVADAQGHSRFSVDLKEHAAQVQAYRAALRP